MRSFARKSWIVFLAGFLAVPPAGPSTPAAAGSPPPNVVVILTDDQRADTMDVMPRTLKWFGSEGTRFPTAFVTTPLCCPSRASIMTGRFVHNHEVHNNSSAPLLDQRSTLQRYLQDAGYHTAIVGKYLNNWDLGIDPPHFSRWAIQNHGYQRRLYNLDGAVRKVRRYTTDFIRDRAIRFLRFFERDDGRPWLLYVTPFAPHEPFIPAKRHLKAKVPAWAPSPAVGEADRTDKPAIVQLRYQPVNVARKARKGQLRTLLSVDELVRKLMLELERLGELESTLAFYTSDNGFFWSEHGLYDKRWPYTEGIQVPLFMRWPGHVTAGGIDNRLAASVDVTATIMEAVDVVPDPDYPLDGRSLLGPSSRGRMLIEHFVDPLDPTILDWASIRTATYQYVEYYDPTTQEAVTFREYYDLVADPWQLTNLLGDADPSDPSPEEVAMLSDRLGHDRRCEGTSGPAGCP